MDTLTDLLTNLSVYNAVMNRLITGDVTDPLL